MSQTSFASTSGLSMSRRNVMAGIGGLSLPGYLQLRSSTALAETESTAKAKSCIIIFAWGGMSHLESFDLKPDAPAEVRGEFSPISTVVPDIQIGEHLPRIAQQTDKLAIVRSIHHDDAAHGRGMFWNLTGHKPPRADLQVSFGTTRCPQRGSSPLSVR